jgi:hypothetical protein
MYRSQSCSTVDLCLIRQALSFCRFVALLVAISFTLLAVVSLWSGHFASKSLGMLRMKLVSAVVLLAGRM